MFGDIFGNLEEKQAELKEKLSKIEIKAEAGEGKVKVAMNAAKDIHSIDIVDELMSVDRKEELEDLLITAFESALSEVSEKEQAASKEMISDMIPGFGGNLPNLGNLFS
ncbi:MAG TPA: YbaB/EbfC family nucleoid-associated protein [Saprospiraceae bacterium]|nr:YbaB/EbfC family nucleoid-associated protein [Saprospiraceae bacterium]